MCNITKIDNHYWIVNGSHIKYSSSFGNEGWYIDDESDVVFKDTHDDFLVVLSIVMGDNKSYNR